MGLFMLVESAVINPGIVWTRNEDLFASGAAAEKQSQRPRLYGSVDGSSKTGGFGWFHHKKSGVSLDGLRLTEHPDIPRYCPLPRDALEGQEAEGLQKSLPKRLLVVTPPHPFLPWRQGAEAALVFRGTTVPLSPAKNTFAQWQVLCTISPENVYQCEDHANFAWIQHKRGIVYLHT